MADPTVLRAFKALTSAYFAFGIGLMAWIPRLAEVKAALGVSAATFGFLLSLGSIGAISANFMGHVANRYGSRRLMEVMSVCAFGLVAAITFVPVPALFGVTVIALSFSVTAYNLGLNTQGLLVQEKIGRSIMGRLHGAWALGALITGFVANLVASYVAPRLHVTVVALSALGATLYLTRSLIGAQDDHHIQRHDNKGQAPALRTIPLWKTPGLVWILAAGAAGGAMMDFMNADWSAIYSRESLGISSGLSGILFTTTMTAMVISRLRMDSLVQRWGMERLVKRGVLLIISGVTFGVAASQWALHRSSALALMFACVGFFIAALGSAPMTPAFYGMANSVQGIPVGVTVARMNLGQQISNWGLKSLVAFVVGVAGLAWAFLLPTAMALVAGAVITHIFRSHFPDHDDRKLVATAPEPVSD